VEKNTISEFKVDMLKSGRRRRRGELRRFVGSAALE
jgi:hypothetical protein